MTRKIRSSRFPGVWGILWLERQLREAPGPVMRSMEKRGPINRSHYAGFYGKMLKRQAGRHTNLNWIV